MKTSYNKAGFILANICWYFIAWSWYKSLFSTIENVSLSKSILILIAVQITTLAINYTIQNKFRLSSINIWMNVTISYGVYTLISYYSVMKQLITKVLLITLLAILTYAILMKNNISTEKQRFVAFIRGSQAFLTVGMLVIMSILCLKMSTIYGIAEVKSINPITERTIENSPDTLICLEDGTWETLSIDERLNILQIITNTER